MFTKINAVLDRAAVFITSAVGTMWCAIAFALLALSSLPSSLGSVRDFVQWLSTTFLQLVLLSIIMVGQRVQGSKTRAHVEAHAAATREHHTAHAQLLHAKLDELLERTPDPKTRPPRAVRRAPVKKATGK